MLLLILVVLSSWSSASSSPPVVNESCILHNFTWPAASLRRTQFDVEDLSACSRACSQDKGCAAYTWHGPQEENLYFAYVCSLFADSMLQTHVPCSNCYSLSLANYVVEGVCQAAGDNVKGASFAPDSKSCAKLCHADNECQYWSWMGETFPHAKNLCLQYESCGGVVPCLGAGCMTGHRLVPVAESAKLCHAQQEDQPTLMLVTERGLVESYYAPGNRSNRVVAKLEDKGLFLPHAGPVVHVTRLKDELWPDNCFHEPLCWTYNLREKTLRRPKVKGRANTRVERSSESILITVGQTLVLIGETKAKHVAGGKKGKLSISLLANNSVTTVSTLPTSHTTSPSSAAVGRCAVAVSDTDFMLLTYNPTGNGEFACRMIRYKLLNNSVHNYEDVPCMMHSPHILVAMSRNKRTSPAALTSIKCAADGERVYVLHPGAKQTWLYDPQSSSNNGWSSIFMDLPDHTGPIRYEALGLELVERVPVAYVAATGPEGRKIQVHRVHEEDGGIAYETVTEGVVEFDRVETSFTLPL